MNYVVFVSVSNVVFVSISNVVFVSISNVVFVSMNYVVFVSMNYVVFGSISYAAFQTGNNGPGAVKAGAVKGLIKCVGVNYWPVCVPVVVTMGPRQHSGKRDDQVVADPGQNDVVVNSLH